MKKIAVCHTINPNSKTSDHFKHPLPYYVITMTGVRRGTAFYVDRVTRLGRGVMLQVCGSGADIV